MNIIGRIIAALAGLVLLAWAIAVYGFWWGFLPRAWFAPLGPVGSPIFLFLIPLASVALLGVSARILNPSPPQRAHISTHERKSPAGKALEIGGTILGVWFWSAFVCMFFTDRYPVLRPYVWWTFAIAAGSFVAFIVATILFSIGYGAHQTYVMYREGMEIGKIGFLGRVLWAVYFAITFVIVVLLMLR